MSETTLKSRRVFDGRLLKVEVLDVELPNGVRSIREIVRHPGAAVILPELPDGRFLFVRQFRKPLEAVLTEAVAGTLDPGETPEQCACRELKEETGYSAGDFRKLGVVFPAPGYTDETLHIYHATALNDGETPAPDADEKVEVVCLARDQVESMIARGELRDAKTLAAWLLWKTRIAEVR